MKGFLDVRFSCREDRGVAGQAIKTGRAVIDDCQKGPSSRFGFNQKEQSQTAHVTVVWSWPIYEVDPQGIQTGKILGVLNYDSTTAGGFALLAGCMISIDPDLSDLCDVFSAIVSA